MINKERVPVIQLLAVWILCRNSFNKVDWYLETWNPHSSVMRGYSGSCGIQDRWLTRPRLSENILRSFNICQSANYVALINQGEKKIAAFSVCLLVAFLGSDTLKQTQFCIKTQLCALKPWGVDQGCSFAAWLVW